jgi:hypothetical protein
MGHILGSTASKRDLLTAPQHAVSQGQPALMPPDEGPVATACPGISGGVKGQICSHPVEAV